MSDAWYVAAFDRGYLERYARRDQGEAATAIATLLRRGYVAPEQRALDLCCGAGRHLREMRAAGVSAVGADLSPHLLAAAAGLPVARADMRSLPFAPASFDAVVQWFTAFGYFAADDENRRVLDEVARALKPSGIYVLDLLNPRVVGRNLVERSETALPDGRTLVEERWIDPDRRRFEKSIAFAGDDGDERLESVRVFEPDELREWLERAGFTPIEVLGDYAGTPFDAEASWRQIAVCRR